MLSLQSSLGKPYDDDKNDNNNNNNNLFYKYLNTCHVHTLFEVWGHNVFKREKMALKIKHALVNTVMSCKSMLLRRKSVETKTFIGNYLGRKVNKAFEEQNNKQTKQNRLIDIEVRRMVVRWKWVEDLGEKGDGIKMYKLAVTK